MKTPSFALALSAAALALSACSAPMSDTQADLLKNPLYARYYYQDQADMMANYVIQNDPILKDAEKKGIVESVRTRALEHLKDENAKIDAGRRGAFMSDIDYATGQTLVLDGTLYFGQTFLTMPGPETYVYLSTLLDPRGESGALLFPDAGAVNIGLLKSPYGAQWYALPADKKTEQFRTVVLWDKRLGRMLGFSQLGQ